MLSSSLNFMCSYDDLNAYSDLITSYCVYNDLLIFQSLGQETQENYALDLWKKEVEEYPCGNGSRRSKMGLNLDPIHIVVVYQCSICNVMVTRDIEALL